jgi:hypothetical protein
MIRHNIQEWEALLNAVGGKLEISKCKISKFTWMMDPLGQMTLTNDDTSDATVIIDHETNQPIQITEIRPNESYKLLGVDLAIDGSNQVQEKNPQQKM